jgi:hypothetical protein
MTNPFIDMLLEATGALTLVFGVLGALFSISLIFFPDLTRRVSDFFNRHIDLNARLAYFDRRIRDDLFVYRHPVAYGLLLIAGAGVTLVFLTYRLDIPRLLTGLGLAGSQRELWELAGRFLAALCRVGAVGGIGVGLFLILAPGRLKRWEERLNTWVATQPLVDRLDVFHHVVNVFSFRHPILIGSFGLALSLVLIALSLVNFFS